MNLATREGEISARVRNRCENTLRNEMRPEDENGISGREEKERNTINNYSRIQSVDPLFHFRRAIKKKKDTIVYRNPTV